jgi:hypothetical protein
MRASSSLLRFLLMTTKIKTMARKMATKPPPTTTLRYSPADLSQGPININMPSGRTTATHSQKTTHSLMNAPTLLDIALTPPRMHSATEDTSLQSIRIGERSLNVQIGARFLGTAGAKPNNLATPSAAGAPGGIVGQSDGPDACGRTAQALWQFMLRARLLLALILMLSVRAGAQSIEWKAIACTIERPESLQGRVLTIYFTEDGHVRFADKEYEAKVNRDEIEFCFPNIENSFTCYTISRISGRFSTFTNLVPYKTSSGACLQSQQPKF